MSDSDKELTLTVEGNVRHEYGDGLRQGKRLDRHPGQGMRVALVTLVLLLATTALPAQEWTVESVTVAPGLTVLMGRGGNIGLSTGEDGALLIDDQYDRSAEAILQAVKATTDKPLRFVINTHWHGDHVGSNEKMAESGAVIVAHDNVRTRMSVGQFSKFWDRQVEASAAGALPVVTFPEEVIFHWNDETIHAIHVPHAHTDGDTIIHFQKANAIHMGDVYFNGIYPFIDVESGGGIEGLIAACDRALELADSETKIIPGHGALSNPQELRNYRLMLETIRGNIQKLIDQGMTLEQVLAANPTAQFDEKLGGGFINPKQMTELAYASLAGDSAETTDKP